MVPALYFVLNKSLLRLWIDFVEVDPGLPAHQLLEFFLDLFLAVPGFLHRTPELQPLVDLDFTVIVFIDSSKQFFSVEFRKIRPPKKLDLFATTKISPV